MKSQIKLGTVFGVELGLDYSWRVIALLITFGLIAQFHVVSRDWSQTVVCATAILAGLLFFACLFAHELSHALVAELPGIPIHDALVEPDFDGFSDRLCLGWSGILGAENG